MSTPKDDISVQDPSSKPYGRSDLPQQQHPPGIRNAADTCDLPEEFKLHSTPYHLTHDELAQVAHDENRAHKPVEESNAEKQKPHEDSVVDQH